VEVKDITFELAVPGGLLAVEHLVDVVVWPGGQDVHVAGPLHPQDVQVVLYLRQAHLPQLLHLKLRRKLNVCVIFEISLEKLENFLFTRAKFCEISVQKLENFRFMRAKFCLAKKFTHQSEFFFIFGLWQHLQKDVTVF
jgi:hypothetical protein